MTPESLWKRFREYHSEVADLGLTLDVSRMGFEAGFIEASAQERSEIEQCGRVGDGLPLRPFRRADAVEVHPGRFIFERHHRLADA